MRVGLPEALLYWIYGPLWLSFFGELGAEVVLSGATNRGMLDAGVRLAVEEACLPVKVFYGHCADLAGKVDVLFVPRLVSVEPRAYICPKFMGLPDMIRLAIGDCVELLAPVIDLRCGGSLRGLALTCAATLGVRSRRLALQAWERAETAQRRAVAYWESGNLPTNRPPATFTTAGDGAPPDPTPPSSSRRLGVIGHPYNIYDRLVSMDVLRRLRGLGWTVDTPETLPAADCAAGAAGLPKELFWTLGRRAYGAAARLIERRSVEGLVHLVSFGCGPDSLVGELVARQAERHRMPFLLLTLDEHTGEAGAWTRLEAFLDMLERREVSSARPS
ncbi:MAG: acyl-CoA dehydratase activase-related protein [Chitinophagales bacterium]